MAIKIFPSLMALDQLYFKKSIELLDLYCAGYHLDLMDGGFVPNTCGDIDLFNELATITNKQLWVHLMVENVIETMKQLTVPAGSLMTFHIETKEDPQEIVK